MFAEWYYATNGHRRGPIPERQLKELAGNGTLLPTDMVWQEGTPDWVPARTVPGLFASSTAVQPAPAGASLFPTASTEDREIHEYHEPSTGGMDDYPRRSRRRRKESNSGVPFVLMLGGVVAVSVIVGIIFAVASSGSVAVNAKSSSKTTTAKSRSGASNRGSYTVRLVEDPHQMKHDGFHTKVVHLKKGDTINIKVRSDLHSDVDLYLVGPYRNTLAKDISLSEHCSVSQTIRSGGNHTIVVTNLGPGNNICRVSYTIQRKTNHAFLIDPNNPKLAARAVNFGLFAFHDHIVIPRLIPMMTGDVLRNLYQSTKRNVAGYNRGRVSCDPLIIQNSKY